MAREIIHAGLARHDVHRARHDGLRGVSQTRSSRTRSSFAERVTGIPADVIRDAAHQYAKADRAMICWTLGITEHHNAVDNVVALINLALLTGHVGRYGCGCNPLRGQNNVQGGGDMGALPNKLPGFQDVTTDEHRTKFERAWGRDIIPTDGWNLTEMMRRDGDGRSSPRSTSSARIRRSPTPTCITSTHLLDGLDHLVVQEIFLTKTAQMAHVVLPATATWAEGEGTVTNSERRVQRVSKSRRAAGRSARRDLDHVASSPSAWATIGVIRRRKTSGTKCARSRRSSPGMSYARLEALDGIPVAVSRRDRIRERSSCTRDSGTTIRRSAADSRRSRSSITKVRSSSRTTSIRSSSRRVVDSSRTTPACRAAAMTRRCIAASRSTCRRKTPSVSASSTATWCA